MRYQRPGEVTCDFSFLPSALSPSQDHSGQSMAAAAVLKRSEQVAVGYNLQLLDRICTLVLSVSLEVLHFVLGRAVKCFPL